MRVIQVRLEVKTEAESFSEWQAGRTSTGIWSPCWRDSSIRRKRLLVQEFKKSANRLASPALVDIQRRMTWSCSSRLPVCFSSRAKPEHNVTSELVNQDSIGCQQRIGVLR